MNEKIKRYLLLVFRLAVSGLALYYVLHKTDLSSLLELIGKSNPLYLAVACMFFIFSKIMSAYRLNEFFHAVEISIPAKINLRLYWLGMFYNLFLPGGIGGDGYKVYYLHKKINAPVKKSILALIFDRITGLLALFVLCMLLGPFIKQKIINDFVFVLLIVSSIAVFYLIVYVWFRVFYGIMNKTNLQSLMVQMAQLIAAWLILKALGNDQDMVTYLFVFLISSVVAVIPFTVGGVGAREITFLYAADILNLDLTASIGLSLLFFFITLFVSFFGMGFVMRPEWIAKESSGQF